MTRTRIPGFTAEESLGKFSQGCRFTQLKSADIGIMTAQSKLSLQLISKGVGESATAGFEETGGCCCDKTGCGCESPCSANWNQYGKCVCNGRERPK